MSKFMYYNIALAVVFYAIFYTCSKEFKDEETIFKAKWK